MHYTNPATQALYRKLRGEGLEPYEAIQTIQLLSGDIPVVPTNATCNTSWGYWKENHKSKHKLPYYHGKKRRF